MILIKLSKYFVWLNGESSDISSLKSVFIKLIYYDGRITYFFLEILVLFLNEERIIKHLMILTDFYVNNHISNISVKFYGIIYLFSFIQGCNNA